MQKKIQKNLHFIGIGGTGMRPLAEIALYRGYRVSGSDQKLSPSTQYLEKIGAKISIGHGSDSLPDDVTTIIVSSAISPTNRALLTAQERGWPILHRSDFLSQLMEGKKPICVSGTHGKTSTTAMLAFMFEALGLEPTAAIGGELVDRETYSFNGQGEYFIAECDESDGTFLKYLPQLSIVTNIDLDHLDFYKNLEGLKQGFRNYIERTTPEGCTIVGWDNPAVRDIASTYAGQRLTFGTHIGCEVRGLKFENTGPIAHYEAIVDKTIVKDWAPLVGKHSFQNILCCLAVAHILELDLPRSAAALREYPGVKRRFSLVGKIDQIKIFDDYAHNPGKIRSCIEGARDAFPHDKIIVIFQPHRYSRLETMYNEFMRSFTAANEVFVLPVYAAGEVSQREFTPQSMAIDLEQESRVKASAYDSIKLNTSLDLSEPTVLITIGAGDVSQLSLEWKDRLNEQATKKERTTFQPKA